MAVASYRQTQTNRDGAQKHRQEQMNKQKQRTPQTCVSNLMIIVLSSTSALSHYRHNRQDQNIPLPRRFAIRIRFLCGVTTFMVDRSSLNNTHPKKNTQINHTQKKKLKK